MQRQRESCLIANNYGGVLVYDINSWYSSSFINCDIVNNKAYFTGGVYASYASSAMFKNCIIWGNVADYYYHTYDNIYYTGDVSPFSYCAIEGGYSGEGNINISSENLGDGYFHPRFANPSPVAGVMEEYADYSWELLEGSI